MAKKEQSKTCAACGTRNKAKWEFCVRCGESLQGVEPSEETAAKPTVVITDSGSEENQSSLGAMAVIGAMVLAAAGVAVWWVQRTPPAAEAAPNSAFQIATLPPAAAGPAPAASGDPALSHSKTLAARGDVAGALEALEKLVAEKPSDPEVQSQYAQALLAAGRRDEAIAHFETAASLSTAPVHKLNLAVALNQAGRTQPAIEQYQQVLLADSRNEQALREIGNLLNRAGKFDQAATYLNQALEGSPNDLSVQQDLAWALESSGNLDGAAGSYRKVLAANPQASPSRARLAEVLLKQQKIDEAMSVIEEGLRQDPSVPLLKRAHASLLERSGKIAEAITEYREYAKTAPNSEDARLMLERANVLEKRAAGGSS